MPRDYPSQAQTGLAKGLEGLFGGIQAGMKGAKDKDLKQAYMNAMYRPKADPFELLKQKQEFQARLQAEKDKAALDRTKVSSAPKPSNKALPRLKAGLSDRAIRAVLQATGAKDTRRMRPEDLQAANAAWKATILPEVADYNKAVRAYYGGNAPAEQLLPEELPDYYVTRPGKKGFVFDDPTRVTTNPEYSKWATQLGLSEQAPADVQNQTPKPKTPGAGVTKSGITFSKE